MSSIIPFIQSCVILFKGFHMHTSPLKIQIKGIELDAGQQWR
jgi:hypothetical protein